MTVQDYKINYKSDFVLTINGDAGWAVPFCIKFWTGMPSQAYFVGFDGMKYVNCRVGDTPTQLLVMFDDHHLPIGPLRMQIAYHTTIDEFPGSVFDEVTNARDVIVTIDGTDYQVLLDFTGEDAPELEFDLPAYANEAERIQNELQRQQNEADRIAAELQREQATAAAVQGAENVNAQIDGNILTVTNRQGVSTSVNTKGEQGAQGPVGPEGPQGEQGETGISIVSFTPKSETSTTLIYTVTFSDGHTQDVSIPKGPKGDTGATGPTGPTGPQGQTGVSITGLVKTGETETDTLYNVTFSNGTTQAVSIPKGEKGDQGEQGPQGPQGPMGDVAVITPEQQAAFTMYSTTGQNTDGPMTQKAVTDALVDSIYDVQLVNISSSYTISNGQAYGNVGSVISTNTDRDFSKVYIAKSDNKTVRFVTHQSLDVSSYVQFVKAGNIITRRLCVSGDYDKNTEYTLKLNFKDDEIGVYVSGTNNSLIIYNLLYVNKFLLKEELLATLSDEDKPVSGKAVCDAFSKEETGFFDINKGKQAYGTVGSAINIGTFQPMEYVRLTDSATVQFKSMQQSVTVSSYVQYVDSNNIVTRLLYTSTSPNTIYTHKIEFQEGEVAVYVSSALDFISVEENLIPDLLDLTTVQEPESLVYNNTEAYNLYNYKPYRKYLLTGVVGGTIQTARTDGGICLKIPLDGVSKITYPMFLSSGGYGSVICDANDIIVWFYSNSTEPTGTYKEVDVSNIQNAKWAYISIYGVNSYNIYIKKAGVKTIDFLRNLLSEDYTSSDTDKALNLSGAHALYELINSLSEKGSSSGLDGFNDFGEMPSCVYGDGNAFLGDGVDGQGNAIIKYSDVIAKYDALVAAYPAFVTKQALGYDASNTIEMYSYTFTPKYYKQSVYLQAGVHGWEPDSVFALCEMMYLICNAYGSDTLSPCIRGNNVLKYLRGNVKFTIVPVVNPWGFNNRADCGIDKRQQAQNNYNGVQLNSAAQWSGNEPECVHVRNIITSISNELSFAIDMHSTVWPDSRTRYGCFYGIINRNAANVPTIYRTYEWLYEFYNQKYPSIVQGDTVPNLLGEGKASVGYLDGIFHSWIYDNYSVEASTMEFSDHVWTVGLHTSTALSVAVNMYMNQIVQQLNDKYKDVTPTDIPSSDYYPAKG